MLKSIVILVVAAVLAFVFNPSGERHRAKIQQTMADSSLLSKALGLGALTAFVSSYHSVGVGSYMAVNGKLVSVGAYGMVFVLQ